MPTALFTKARTAGLVALTLVTAAAGAYPATAASILSQKPSSDMSSDRHDDCDSRREVKYYFQEEYYLHHVKVSNTHDHYVYKVTGYGEPAKEEAALTEGLRSHDSSDYIRYVFLFDACEHVVQQLQPRRSVSEM